MPIPDRRIFHRKDMRPQGIWGIRPSFPGLSPCPGQVAYVLLTSAPVAAKGIATLALPLDLHVLSLSLAFILSQDQTLRCVCCLFLFSLKKKDIRNSLSRSARSSLSLVSIDSLCSHLSLWNLDRRSAESSFLVSHLLVNFLTANISMISCPPGSRALPVRRQKNRSTRNGSS